MMQSYMDALLAEIGRSLESYPRGRDLISIYFGGGTPSRMDLRDIEKILSRIASVHGLDSVREITFEANPDDIRFEYLDGLKNLGITRLSMGIQSFEPGLLTFMNRAHSADEARKSLELIKKCGFKTFTCDLIYGNPGQSSQTLINDIDTLLSFEPPHVSAYALTIEPNTRLGKYHQLGRLDPLEDELVVEQMNIVADMLARHEIHRYEVSNFARRGHESVHNSNYWSHTPYLGLGPGAHSMDFRVSEDGRILEGFRWSNPPDLKKYCEAIAPGPAGRENLSPEQMAEERLLMGLRTREGVSIAELRSRYGYHFSDKQMAWMQDSSQIHFGDSILIQKNGLPVADKIILELISRH